MIVDAHTHAFPPAVIARRESLLRSEPAFAEIYENAAAQMATAQDVLAAMDAAGVERSVICNYAWRDDALIDETNEYLINEALRSGGRLLPFVSVSLAGAGRHGGADTEEAVGARKGDVRSIVRQMAAAGARGIGELRPEASGYDLANSDEADLLAWAAAAFDLALLVHVTEPAGHAYRGKAGGASLASLERFAASSAGVAVIAAHWGGGLPFYALMPEVRDALANVYFDTAAEHLLYDARIYRHAVELVGVEKILWASDFPLVTQEQALARTRSAGLTESELAAVLGGNAARLLGL
jgi:predicted TIM-barrel fold metal-dependent hydrolase